MGIFSIKSGCRYGACHGDRNAALNHLIQEDICFLGLPYFEIIQYTALKFFLLHAVGNRILLVELIQEFGAILRDFIPVILVDKASVAEADSLLPLDQDLQLFLCFLIGPVELGGQYLRNREVPALLLKLQLQDL